jgi:hypothetical protein
MNTYLDCLRSIREAARQWLVFDGGRDTEYAVAAATLAYGSVR